MSNDASGKKCQPMSASVTNQQPLAQNSRSRVVSQIMVSVLVIGMMIGLGYFGRSHFAAIEQWLAGLGWLGPVVFSGVYLALVICCFPVSVLGFSAGSLFGFGWGTVLLLVNGVITGLVMYGIARRFGQQRAASYLATRPRLAAFANLAQNQSTRLMVLLRLSPFNYGVVCYILGASRVRFIPYLCGLLAILPSAIAQSYFGYAALKLGRGVGQNTDTAQFQELWTGVGLVVCLVLMIVIGNLARKALQTAADQQDTAE